MPTIDKSSESAVSGKRQKAKSAVVTVGDGRGFIVNYRHHRLVVTAAHCLPHFPPPHGASDLGERTYGALLAPLGAKPTVWAECLFADPIADVAVLGSPDNQALFDEADAYETLVQTATPLSIVEAPTKGSAWLLALNGRWFGCVIEYLEHADGPLWISNPKQPIVGGMSGSPIISDDGAAIGVVCLSSNRSDHGPNPRLMRDLPGWLLRAQTTG